MEAAQQVPLVGLTGGVAAGKTTVAELLAKRGAAVIDADALAREVVAPGSQALQEIEDRFGSRIIKLVGSLDRAALAALVFHDETSRAALEGLIHPRVVRLSRSKIAACAAAGPPYVLYEAALLVEKNRHHDFDAMIVVTAAESVRMARLVSRGLSVREARARIAAQAPAHDKISIADYVIYNEGRLQLLQPQALQVHKALLDRFRRGQ